MEHNASPADAFVEHFNKAENNQFSNKRCAKGQVFSGDFVISIAVFLFALAIILPLFSQVSDRVHQTDELKDIQSRALFVSEALVKSAGYPANWNSTTVVTAGFADGNALNVTKIRYFLGMPYGGAQDSMALAGVNFNITFEDLQGYNVFTGASNEPVAYFLVSSSMVQQHLDGSGIVWDMYYGGSGGPPASNARNVYNGTKAGMFNSMVANQSVYKTIIIEKPELTQAEVNIDQLEKFVSTGGVLILVGHADLLASGFSVAAGQQAPEDGIVMKADDFLDAQAGSSVVFGDAGWYIAGGGADVLVAPVSNSSRAFIGAWEHGVGTIYYIADFAGSVDGRNLSQSLDIVGKEMAFGTALPQSGTVVAANRDAILKKRQSQFVSMRLSLWI